MADGTPIIIKKKKVHGGHGHHGGSWKVAYADFVTAMMAFFMVMWIMGLSDDNKSSIQGYFNDPLGFQKNPPRSKSIMSLPGNPKPKSLKHDMNSTADKQEEQQVRKLQSKLEQNIAGDPSLKALLKNVEITVTQEGLKVELVEASDTDFFQSGSAILSPSAIELVKKIAPVLSKSGRTMMVEGHTDSVPYPSPFYTNWDLSSDRANALRRALSSYGVDQHQFTGVRAWADTQPKYPSNPKDSRNRRVSLLLPFGAYRDNERNLPKQELEAEIKKEGPDVSPAPVIQRNPNH